MTMAAQPRSYYITPNEYLRRERAAETKSEYYDGVIVAMAGASPEHNIIAANIIIQLNTSLTS
jgi:Uma2 family endonuclease